MKKDWIKEWDETPYPEMIRKLPQIETPLEEVRGWVIQSPSQQVVFFDLPEGGSVPPHSHCSQWGIVVEGKMKLTIGEKTAIYQKGDWYFIPEGVVHSATFLTRIQVIDVFDDPARYRKKG